MMIWDERKRQANLVKHGLDFADAYLVYENPRKVSASFIRNHEARKMDIAFAGSLGTVLALVYAERGPNVRVISFRYASREERKSYAEANRKSD
jgi:uncharacterized protein